MDLTENRKKFKLLYKLFVNDKDLYFWGGWGGGGLFCCCFNTLCTAEWQDSAFIGNIFIPGPCIQTCHFNIDTIFYFIF